MNESELEQAKLNQPAARSSRLALAVSLCIHSQLVVLLFPMHPAFVVSLKLEAYRGGLCLISSSDVTFFLYKSNIFT